jgi:hypothetical protein
MQPRSFISFANPVVLPCGSACAITPQPFARNIPGNISSAMARFLPWSLKSSTSFSTAAIPITALPASVAPTAAWNTCRRSVARCAASVPLANNGVPGEVLTLHTFGDYLNFRPHIHAIATDGLFDRTGAFTPLPDAQLRQLNARGIQRLLISKKAQVLSAPKLTQYANTQAEVRIVHEIPYFAPTNSLYDLRFADVGISAAVKVILADGDVVTLDTHITQTTMTGRKKLPTADLDAGEPLLDKQEIKTVVKAKLGEDTFLGSSRTKTATGRHDYLLVIARVTREGK